MFLIAQAPAQKIFSDDNLFTVGWQGGVESCLLTLLPPPAKHSIDRTSPCAWHSKVNRLFNPLSWHAYEVWAMPVPPPSDGAFVFHLLWGTGLRRQTQEGVKLVPRGPSLVNVPCCTWMCCKWNKDIYDASSSSLCQNTVLVLQRLVADQACIRKVNVTVSK